MDKWKEFELKCTEFLNNKYGNYFNHLGFSNSTISDIKYQKNNCSFFIEAKMPSAQSGQFVLLPDTSTEKFVFSPRNKSLQNENTSFIINHINNNFEKYANAGTSGENIDISQNVFSKWIMQFYKQKGVRFIITKNKDYIIFPINSYEKYFHITAKFRVKKSGSSSVPINNQELVLKKINSMNIKFELLDDFKIMSKENLDKVKFTAYGSEYMFRYLSNNVYRIRKLSKTRNANVIFSIELISEQHEEDLVVFQNAL